MQTAAGLLRKLQAVDLLTVMGDVITDNPQMILSRNKYQLTNQGVDSKNRPLAPYRSPSYAIRKKNNGAIPPLGTPNYKETGAFQEAMGLEVQGDIIRFFSMDSKAPLLEERSPELYGLTDESKDEVRPDLLNETAKKLKQIIGLP